MGSSEARSGLCTFRRACLDECLVGSGGLGLWICLIEFLVVCIADEDRQQRRAKLSIYFDKTSIVREGWTRQVLLPVYWTVD